MDLQDNDSVASIKALMNDEPISLEEHSERLRRQVQNRRMLEDARDLARDRAADLYQ